MSNQQYWIDLSGVINLQKSLLTQIQGSAANGDAAVVGDINTALSGIASNLSASDSAIGPTLTYQQEVKDILDRENARLTNRKNAIDKAYDGQKRMVALTDSVTAKNRAYNMILLVLVVVLLFVFLIKLVHSFELIPSILVDILIIIVVAIGLIICVYFYIDIKRRSNMDFNQITLAEPAKKTPDQIQKEAEQNAKSGNLGALVQNSNAASGCKGSACCPTGTTFNEKYNVCVPDMVPFGTAGVDNTNKGNYKFFASGPSGSVTYTWKDATAATPTGCGSVNNYDPTILACKPTTSGFTTILGAAEERDLGAKPFSATEYTEYSKV